ncbi:YtxH domain-containing protein [bacterium]|nr:MAG: YtxH domain-containing protein [bacterium]
MAYDFDFRRRLLNRHDDSNEIIYLLAGVGLGAIIGAAAGLLFAPKSGEDLRGDLEDRFKELKGKTDEWITEQKAKHAIDDAADELGV